MEWEKQSATRRTLWWILDMALVAFLLWLLLMLTACGGGNAGADWAQGNHHLDPGEYTVNGRNYVNAGPVPSETGASHANSPVTSSSHTDPYMPTVCVSNDYPDHCRPYPSPDSNSN